MRIGRSTALASIAVALTVCVPVARCGGPAASNDLIGPARKIAAEQVKRFGSAYRARIDPNRHIVYVSALDDEHLQQTIALVSRTIDAQQRTLLTATLRWNVTVLLPTVDDYAPLAPAEGVIGFYDPNVQRVTSIDRGRVLIHEFTHALHHADTAPLRQQHPPWISEGIATLFESSEITPSGLVPFHCPRLLILQKAIREKTTIPLAEFVKMGQKAFMENPQVAYAQARYLLYFLNDRQRLRQWYERTKTGFHADPTGVRALEWAINQPLERVETQWHAWVLEQKLEVPAHRFHRATLGLQLQDTPQGVKVVGVEDGSAAQASARVQKDDLILTFNGTKVVNMSQLAALIRTAGANRTVAVEVQRRGHKLTVQQPLGAVE